MSLFKYNYIIYNNADYKDGTNDDDGYNTICFQDLRGIDGVNLIGGPMPKIPRFLAYLIIILRKFRIPCKVLKPFVKKNIADSRSTCVLIIRIFDANYLNWMRLKYPQSKFVLFLRDLYETKLPHVDYYRQEKLIDYWGSYDIEEKKKYGMQFYYPEIESKIDIKLSSSEPTYDLFFAGAAKKRYNELIEAYDYFTSFGIKCFFIIMDVSESEKQTRDGISYTNEFISYRKMLEYSIRANCLLEINQEGAVGNTSRFLESVIYNKKLITNNNSLIGGKYCNPKYIQIFKSITEVNPDFVKEKIAVDYGYEDDFSPVGLVRHIDSVLSNSL